MVVVVVVVVMMVDNGFSNVLFVYVRLPVFVSLSVISKQVNGGGSLVLIRQLLPGTPQGPPPPAAHYLKMIPENTAG